VRHIREDNPEAARQVAADIFQSLQRLTTFPHMGRSGQKPNTRELPVRSYVIVYRVTESFIEPLRIWHSAQARRDT
jgi:plasmid stabilization system protein ParE